uniref:Sialin-like n=1 Tax=Saccoglossus kowalevskii TaxID=10224 RepID=A0ABM0MQF8_SACKO|nr:PREDICTED: sialin-like [Saccoglossus kowalevskii]
MVNNTGDEPPSSLDECGLNASDVENTEYGDFYWSSYEQGILLGAYFYGYVWTGILGGWMERKFGGYKVYGTSFLLASVVTMLTPASAWWGFWACFAMRFLLGFFQGVVFPSHHGMWGKWAPPLERSKLISYSSSGLLTLVWLAFWYWLVFDAPDDHPRISENERRYLLESIGENVVDKGWHVPWTSVFSSLQVWGLTIGHFCQNWGHYTLLTSLPIYLDQVLGFGLAANGFISSLTSLTLWIFMMFYGWLADVARQRRIMSTILVRRLLVSMGKLRFYYLLKVIVYIVNMGSVLIEPGCSTPGFKVNHVEIAPKYGGILFGITNTASTIAGFLAPLVVGILTDDQNTIEQWRIVFWIAGIIYCIGGVVLLATLKVDVLDWAIDPLSVKKEDEAIQVDMVELDFRTGHSNEIFHDEDRETIPCVSSDLVM